ncbi:MAG TPA: DUF6766 family protein [Rhabdochlamydiaceae bacterium]
MRRLIRPIKDNSLSIVFFSLFAICISIQSYAAWLLQNETLASYGHTSVGYWDFLSSGTYLEGLASNWQAAVLQLASLILLSSFLFQRGAPHSLNPQKAQLKQKWIIARHFSWVYRHSFFIAFLLLFVLSFVLHIFVGASAFNEERALMGQPSISIPEFLLSAKFWTTTLETWQAEYLVIAIYVVFSVFLRQQDSPESKKIESKNKTTGSSNK